MGWKYILGQHHILGCSHDTNAYREERCSDPGPDPDPNPNQSRSGSRPGTVSHSIEPRSRSCVQVQIQIQIELQIQIQIRNQISSQIEFRFGSRPKFNVEPTFRSRAGSRFRSRPNPNADARLLTPDTPWHLIAMDVCGILPIARQLHYTPAQHEKCTG